MRQRTNRAKMCNLALDELEKTFPTITWTSSIRKIIDLNGHSAIQMKKVEKELILLLKETGLLSCGFEKYFNCELTDLKINDSICEKGFIESIEEYREVLQRVEFECSKDPSEERLIERLNEVLANFEAGNA